MTLDQASAAVDVFAHDEQEGLNLWPGLNQVSGSRQLCVMRFVFVKNVQTCHVSALGCFFSQQVEVWGPFFFFLKNGDMTTFLLSAF